MSSRISYLTLIIQLVYNVKIKRSLMKNTSWLCSSVREQAEKVIADAYKKQIFASLPDGIGGLGMILASGQVSSEASKCFSKDTCKLCKSVIGRNLGLCVSNKNCKILTIIEDAAETISKGSD